MRILGIDYGGKRIGLALSDELLISAQPLTVIKRESEDAVKPVLKVIASLADEYGITEIVLGFPRYLSGDPMPFAELVTAFAERLRKRFPQIKVALWDERLSSTAAERSLKEFGFDGRERRQRIDETAAAIILQGYMEYLRNKNIHND